MGEAMRYRGWVKGATCLKTLDGSRGQWHCFAEPARGGCAAGRPGVTPGPWFEAARK